MSEPRRRYVGSGDIAAIMAWGHPELAPSLAKWKTVGDVWLRLVHDIDLRHKPSMTRGLREENPLREVYRQAVGPVSELPGLIKHPRFEWAGGSPDGLGLDRIVELKTHSAYNTTAWGDTTFESPTDLVPAKYDLQCQWLCGLADFSFADLLMGFGHDTTDADGAPIFSWTETRLYRIQFNAELYAECERLAEIFYVSHIASGRPPDVLPVENRRAFKGITNGHGSKSSDAAEGAHQETGGGDGLR